MSRRRLPRRVPDMPPVGARLKRLGGVAEQWRVCCGKDGGRCPGELGYLSHVADTVAEDKRLGRSLEAVEATAGRAPLYGTNNVHWEATYGAYAAALRGTADRWVVTHPDGLRARGGGGRAAFEPLPKGRRNGDGERVGRRPPPREVLDAFDPFGPSGEDKPSPTWWRESLGHRPSPPTVIVCPHCRRSNMVDAPDA